MSSQLFFTIQSDIDIKIAITRTLRAAELENVEGVDRAQLATIVSELATNMLKYAGGGKIEFNINRQPNYIEFQIIASDRGPGIANISLAMSEHYSSGSSLGLGLPGIKRLADQFTIVSTPETGTHIRVIKRVMLANLHDDSNRIEIGEAHRAYRNSHYNGDQVASYRDSQQQLVALIDATGHGNVAYQTAILLAEHLRVNAQLPLPTIMQVLHEQALTTVGASVGIMRLMANSNSLEYIGVGNVNCLVFADKRYRGLSKDGLIGQRLPTLRVQHLPFYPGSVAMLFSDGISQTGVVSDKFQTRLGSAKNIAQQILSRHGKIHDDASCVVMKWNQ